MRRLRRCADLSTELLCTFTPRGRERRKVFGERMMSDPNILALRTAPLFGPVGMPTAAFDDDVLTRALAFD